MVRRVKLLRPSLFGGIWRAAELSLHPDKVSVTIIDRRLSCLLAESEPKVEIAMEAIVAVVLLNDSQIQIHYEEGPFEETWIELKDISRKQALVLVHELRQQVLRIRQAFIKSVFDPYS